MYTKTLAVHVPIKVNFPTANQITRWCKIKLTALHWRCSWSLFLLLCWGLCCLQTLTTEVLKSFSFLCYVPEIIGFISALSTAAWDLQGAIWMGRCTQYKGAPDGQKNRFVISVLGDTLKDKVWEQKNETCLTALPQSGFPVFSVAETLHSCCLLQTCHILQPHKVTMTLH